MQNNWVIFFFFLVMLSVLKRKEVYSLEVSRLGFQTKMNWDPFGHKSQLVFSPDFESINCDSMRTHLPLQCGAERASHRVVLPSTPCPGHLGNSFLLSLIAASSHFTQTVIPETTKTQKLSRVTILFIYWLIGDWNPHPRKVTFSSVKQAKE